MTIIPAIDILGGECVRLYQGSYDSARSYAQDPVQIAVEFEKAGARLIHLVDLDAARSKGNNREVLRKIREAVSCALEVGGGIRNSGDIEALLSFGINQLVLETVLVRNPEQVAGWCREYGQVFMGGIDALAGQVRIAGWQQGSTLEDVDLARKVARLGLAGIIYTSIGRDGTLQGPDINETNRVAEASELPVVLSGGIGSEEDVGRVYRERHSRVAGVLLGKAIYEKKVDLAKLIRNFQKPRV